MKSLLAKGVVAVLVGGVSVGVAGAAGTKVATLQKYPIITPIVLFGIGLLLFRRGRVIAGVSLMGAAGALLGLQALVKFFSSSAPAPSQSAGVDDAGAGALFGPGGKKILADQNALGFDDAGAMFGSAGRSFMRAADAMGYETG